MLLLLASNPVFDAYRQSDFFGKLIFFSLFALSILTWGLFLQKWLKQREVKQIARYFEQHTTKIQQNPLTFELPHLSGTYCTLYRTLKRHAGELLNKNRYALPKETPVYLSRSDMDLLEAHLMTTISSETKGLEKNLFVLSTIVALAPFLGLLGTVWGILITFSELQAGVSANANAAVMGGLATALGTTVVGLVVAVPALIAYNYLKSSVTRSSTDMEDFSYQLLASVELHYRKVDVTP